MKTKVAFEQLRIVLLHLYDSNQLLIHLEREGQTGCDMALIHNCGVSNSGMYGFLHIRMVRPLSDVNLAANRSVWRSIGAIYYNLPTNG